ncbi:MAG: MraY family glycosyltransferase [Prolixibacteraceae bacterium]
MSVVLIHVVTILVSLFVTMVCIPTLVVISKEKKLFDEPNGRSAATVVVPTLGGLAVYLGFVVSLTISHSWISTPNLALIFGCLTMMLFLGLKDDILVLSPSKKLVVQLFVAALLVVAGDFRFTSFHDFLGIDVIPYWASFLVSVFACIVIINAFNLIDGIDGLASGLSIIISATFGAWFAINGKVGYSLYCFSLVGALVGFFYFNFKGGKNKIFMGDTGSMLIGTIMYIFVVVFNQMNLSPENLTYAVSSAPAISFGILIYPLYDVLRVFTIRAIHKKSPMSPDKNHIHHRMLALGLTHHKATAIIISFNIVFIISVFALHGLGNELLMLYILVVFASASMIPSLIIDRKELVSPDDPFQTVVVPPGLKKKRPTENCVVKKKKAKKREKVLEY